MTQELKNRSSEKGFTLVELAIVMIIIGLLIGGILKGQELIANAALTSTVTQIKAVDGAASTFKDMYNAFPGDTLNANARIPNCAAAPCLPGSGTEGNGTLETAPDTAQGAEELAFWSQLGAADVLAINNVAAGIQNLESNIDGTFFTVGYSTGAAADFLGSAPTAFRGGHYLLLSASNGTAAYAAGNEGLTPNEAARIDTKSDDGAPHTGSIRASGGLANAAGDCSDVNTAAGIYREAEGQDSCDLYIRFQQ